MSSKQFSEITCKLDDLIKKEKIDNKVLKGIVTKVDENILEVSLEKPADIPQSSSYVIDRNPCKILSSKNKTVTLRVENKKKFLKDQRVSLHDIQQNILIRKLEQVNDEIKDDKINESNKKTLDILLKDEKSGYDEIHYSNSKLNPNQELAVKKALSTTKFHIIQGPPGSGKTHTIVEIINQLHKKDKRILITAHTHVAIDNILEKLSEISNNDILRIGKESKIAKNSHEYTMDEHVKRSPLYEQIMERREVIDNLKDEIKQSKDKQDKHRYVESSENPTFISRLISRFSSRYEEGVSLEENMIKNSIEDKQKIIKETQLEINEIKQNIETDILKNVSIIASTVLSSRSHLTKDIEFDYVVMDEASQVPLYLSLLPLLKTDKFIIIGDHKQLQPISNENADIYLNKSIFNLLIKKYPENHTFLNIQYRMNHEISDIASYLYYSSKLKTFEDVADQKIEISNKHALLDNSPVVYIDTANVGYIESNSSSGCVNKFESNLILSIIKSLLDCGISSDDIGVISPYRKQKLYITKLLRTENINVVVDTVYRFQGKEKDIIIMSFCKSNNEPLIANQTLFLSNENQLNVSITRSRKKLIIIGDSATLSSATNIKKLIKRITPLNTIYLQDLMDTYLSP